MTYESLKASPLAFSALGALLALLVTGVPTSAPVARSAERYRIRETQIADGLLYKSVLDRDGPNRIKVLEVDPTSSLTLDVALANDTLPGRETTSAMTVRKSALAGVNAAVGLPSGRPIGVFEEDGDLKTSPLVWGRAFAITYDEQRTFFGHPEVKVKARHIASGALVTIDGWNAEEPAFDDVGGFTPAGGDAAKPPPNACSIRLYPSAEARWSPSGRAVIRAFYVDRVRCDAKALARRGGTVLSSPLGSETALGLATMLEGDQVEISFSLGWADVLDAIPGNPTLLEGGVVTAYECDAYFCEPQPRTGVGVTEDGRLLLVTVDGRQPRRSVGMTLTEFAAVFQWLGATSALNLDGGGSTTMVLDGRIVNRPSDDAGERAVSSALLVLPGIDPEETVPAPALSPTPTPVPTSDSTPTPTPVLTVTPTPTSTPTPEPTATPLSAVFDPGSTGGYLDALARGVFGAPPAELPPRLRWLRGRFLASWGRGPGPPFGVPQITYSSAAHGGSHSARPPGSPWLPLTGGAV